MHFRRMVVTVVVLGLAAVDASAQRSRSNRERDEEQSEVNAFQWGGELASGQRLILRSINGRVTVEPSRGRTLEVTATKKWRKGDPAAVKISATRVNNARDVLVCAVWTADAECTEDSYNSKGRWPRDQDTYVEFTIHLPAGSNALLNVTNGDIEVTGTSGSIEAHTTNGDVTAESTEGSVTAGTTNGDVNVAMMKLPGPGASYHTTNGTITLTLPAGIDADISAHTTNGAVRSDFEITMSGTLSHRSLNGRIGRGGPRLDLSTTNGSIVLRKR